MKIYFRINNLKGGEKVNINWMAVGIGFIVGLVLYIIGMFVGFIGTLAPIIGGLTAAYVAGGEYMDGAVNGGLAGGIAGFIATLVIVLFFGAAAAIMGYAGLGALFIIIGAIFGLIIGAILGAIGGFIGILIKGQLASKQPVA